MAQIAALSQLSRYCPDAFEQKSDIIVNYLVKKVLMVPKPADMVWTLRHYSRTVALITSPIGG